MVSYRKHISGGAIKFIMTFSWTGTHSITISYVKIPTSTRVLLYFTKRSITEVANGITKNLFHLEKQWLHAFPD